jgi:hypothetical protein
MPKFRNRKYANEPVVFAYIGEITLDADGCFETDHPDLIAALRKIAEFEEI